MKKLLLGIIIGLGFTTSISYAATTLFIDGGGTGRNSFTASQLLYGNGTNALSSVATTTASCAGTASCTAFTIIGASPVTITGSAGGGSSFGQSWELFGSGGWLAPTTTKGIIVNASSTIGAGTQIGGLTTFGGATTTLNAYFGAFVGIGSTTPYFPLSISRSDSAVQPYIMLNNTGAFAAGEPTVDFYNSGAGGNFTTARIGSAPGNSFAASYLRFSVADAAKAIQERMRIDVSGNVGIATTTPYARLSVAGDVAMQNFYATSTTATSTVTNALYVASSTPTQNLMFAVGSSSPLFTIERSSGKIGFGAVNTSPAKYVFGAGSNANVNPNINLLVTDTVDARAGVSVADRGLFFKSPGSATASGGIFAFNYLAGTAMNVTLGEFGGNVGITTTTPGALLDVFSTASSTIRVDSNSATQGGQIFIKDRDGVGYTCVTANNGVLTAKIAVSATVC